MLSCGWSIGGLLLIQPGTFPGEILMHSYHIGAGEERMPSYNPASSWDFYDGMNGAVNDFSLKEFFTDKELIRRQG